MSQCEISILVYEIPGEPVKFPFLENCGWWNLHFGCEISILEGPLYFSTLFPGPKKRPSPLQPVLVALVLGLSHQIPLRAEVLVQPRLPVHGGTGCWETMGNHGKLWGNTEKNGDFNNKSGGIEGICTGDTTGKGKKDQSSARNASVLSEQLDSCYKQHELVRYVYHRPQFA